MPWIPDSAKVPGFLAQRPPKLSLAKPGEYHFAQIDCQSAMSPTNANSPPTQSETPFPYGAEWVRVDFHLHTAADKEFRYLGDVNYYASNYVDALAKARIWLGVITNHNKFDLGEFKALRSAAKKKGIVLLPGVELSVNDGANGIHTLVVFSEEWLAEGQDHINPFLTLAFEGKVSPQFENENARSSLSLDETMKKLEGQHRDFFLVFAHVEERSGLWAELQGGRLGDLGKAPLFRRYALGFQKVRTHDGAGKGGPCRTKAQEWLKDAYPAEVEGSDPKSVDEIGQGKPCFVKLGELSFNAVRFALRAHCDRVAKAIPHRSTSYLCSAFFEGGALDGQTIRFSPELNTLIGIRGSGKSSILETIRYALDIPLPQGKRAADVEYKDGLVKRTLASGGKVTLTAVDTYGQEFTVSRIFREAPNVYLAGKLQPGVSIRETVLRRPIYFGQKELAAGDAQDLVEKLTGEKLAPLRSEIEEQRQKVKDAVDRFRRLKDSAQQKAEYERQLSDAQFRLKKFKEHGVESKLNRRLGFQKDQGVLDRIGSRVAAFQHGFESFVAEYEDDLRNAASYQSAENKMFFERYFDEYRGVLAQLDALKEAQSKLGATSARLDQMRAEFDATAKGLQDEFAQIERELAEELRQTSSAAIQPDDFLQQQQRKLKAEQMIEALAKQEAQQVSSRDALLRELEALNELWLNEFKTIKTELDRVNANHTALQVELDFKGDRDAAVAFMKSFYKGSGTHEATLASAMENYRDFGALFRDLAQAKTKAGSSPDRFEEIFLKNLAELLTWQVPNRFRILYHGKELRHHSLGQRASALILFVLSQQANDVIIIDQPEDDLDNQTIYDDVIALLCKLKPQTQFIFATHNPNVPVLGDAEQIHACSYQDDKIKVHSGGIDAQTIQEAIIGIMEGGREAFAKRSDIYDQWKQQSSSK
jgi:chromosome segregation protein